MFDLLKKKITGLVGNITKSISKEEKPEEKPIEELKPAISTPEQIQAEPQEKARSEPQIQQPAPEPKKETFQPTIEKEDLEELDRILDKPAAEEPKAPAVQEPKPVEKPAEQMEAQMERTKAAPPAEKITEPPKEQKTIEPPKKERPEVIPVIEHEKPKVQEKEELRETEIKVKPSLFTKVKAFISPEVTIKENDISSAMDDFELQLLTADVALPVAEEIISELKGKLVGKSVKSSELEEYVRKSLYLSISEVIRQERIDLIGEIEKSKKPYKILFIGPNGAGKTTTIAKVAHYLKKNGKSCVISASDTFRAAAIEQTIEHAKRLDIPFIKHDYGSDPAAVAFDAVKYAEAKNIDVVLIDSAGRQETNRNLIEQLKKIERITSPNLKVFVGEGITGNALLGQVSEFNNAISLNGVILTKLDVDAKGGTVISVKKATGVPLLFIGVGQEYDDLLPFDEKYIINRIMSA